MELIKQYLAQSITAASNNLRLTTHQLEAVGLLRECLINSSDIEKDISRMKRITELSTFAIRLNEIYNFLTRGKVDFSKISEKFKEHSKYLINDLNQLLVIDNPEVIRSAIQKLNSAEEKKESDEVSFNLTGEKTNSEQLVTSQEEKEKINNGTDNVTEKDEVFRNFETMILKPIKPIDTMLKKLAKNEINYEDLTRLAEIIKLNGEIADKNGFEIISSMHNIISKALLMIKSRDLMPGKEVIESLRSCLIVIVAVVRGKDVDITNYLNKAEEFQREMEVTKIQG